MIVAMDATLMILSSIPGGIGFVLLVYGKKYGRVPHLVTGVAFLVYPYFTESALSMLGVGLVIGAAFWLALRAGW